MARKQTRNTPVFDGEMMAMMAFLGLVVVIALGLVGASVAENLAGRGNVPLNPLSLAKGLIAGTYSWTTPMTVGVVILVVIAAAIGGVVAVGVARRELKGDSEIRQAQRTLHSSQAVSSLSKKQVSAQTTKLLGETVSSDWPGFQFAHVAGRPKQGLFSGAEDLFLIIFGPRMGKTTTQVIPAIIDAPGVVVTTSNKPDIVDDTIRYRTTKGVVWVFDPQRITASAEAPFWYVDLLDMIRGDKDLMDAKAARLADIFCCAARGATSGGGTDTYWVDMGKNLLAYYLLAATIDERPITDVFMWIMDPDNHDPEAILAAHEEFTQLADALSAIYRLPEQTRGGIFSQAQQMASPLGRIEAKKWITPRPGATKFDAAAFVRSTGDTLYVLSKEGADNAAALTTALVALVMSEAERYGEEHGGRLPVPLLAALDEAANVVTWPELPALYSHYGSRSIIIMTILQSYAQGVKVWGKEGMEALWSAAAILLYGGGVRDKEMLEKMESLVGRVDEETFSQSYSSQGRSTSSSLREKTILTVSDLASLPRGKAVLFAATRAPQIVELDPWWEREWPDEVKALVGKE